MMGGPGGGGASGGQDPNPLGRFVAGAVVTLVMSAVMITMYSLVPQYEPRLEAEGPKNAPVRDGVWEKNDLFGLVDTQWNLRDGTAEGPALQFYSNGSLFRELEYRAGRLDGPVREYYEKGPYRRSPARGRIAGAAERAAMAGALKKVSHARDGVLEGPYEIYYPDGVLKESGVHENGRRRASAKYHKDGRPRNIGTGAGSKEDVWALGR